MKVFTIIFLKVISRTFLSYSSIQYAYVKELEKEWQKKEEANLVS